MKKCLDIKYPKKSWTMSMSHHREIGHLDALILGTETYKAQRSFAATIVMNYLFRLKGVEEQGLDLYEHAKRVASIAYRETQSEQWVALAFICHIGKVIAPANPYSYLAAVAKPYIDVEVYEEIKDQNSKFYKWIAEAFKNTNVEILDEKKLLNAVKDLFWAHLIFRPVPHEKTIPK